MPDQSAVSQNIILATAREDMNAQNTAVPAVNDGGWPLPGAVPLPVPLPAPAPLPAGVSSAVCISLLQKSAAVAGHCLQPPSMNVYVESAFNAPSHFRWAASAKQPRTVPAYALAASVERNKNQLRRLVRI